MTASHDACHEDGRWNVFPMREARRPPCLEELLEIIVAEVTAARQQRRLPAVTITLDVTAEREPTIDAQTIAATLAPLVAAACETATAPAPASDGPRLHEVCVTAIDTSRGLEIEVADSGPGPASLAADALTTARAWAERHGGGLDVTACPEGGAAVTLLLPSRRAHGQSIRPAA